jgi:hypothetical protein
VCIQGHPSNPSYFITGGKENIRFWKVKQRNVIVGTSLTLNSNGRDKVFTDIAYETSMNDEHNVSSSGFAYFCTASGELFKVSTN